MSAGMLDFVWTGTLFSAALALLAWFVQSSAKRPGLAHALWVLVLAKLLIPSWIGIPGMASPFAEQALASAGADLTALTTMSFQSGGSLPSDFTATLPAIDLEAVTPLAEPMNWGALALAIWALGSLLILLISGARVLRFNRRLLQTSEAAPWRLRAQATALGQALGLRKIPRVLLTEARLTPMVWGLGIRPTIVLPRILVDDPSRGEELHWALAHELGHVRRGDHLVRWLEWLVAVAFWWNPVAWWARRNLRINEEICCDRLVVEQLQAHPKTYANSLLNVVEFLARPELRPPAVASAINSGGAFEKRLTMILTPSKSSATPRWMRVLSLAAAVALLPLGFAEAQERDRSRAEVQDPERQLTVEQYQRIAERLDELVDQGRISKEEAEAKLKEVRSYIARDERAARAAREQQQENELRRRAQEAERLAQREMQLAELAEKLDQSVQSGLLTKGEAREIMEKAVTRLRGERVEAEVQEQRDPRADYTRRVDQWHALVDAGRLSQIEFDEKRLQLELQLRKLDQADEMQAYKMQLDAQRAAMEADLQKAIDQGMLTIDQAERKVRELQEQMDRAMADLAAAQSAQEQRRRAADPFAERKYSSLVDPRQDLDREAEALRRAKIEFDVAESDRAAELEARKRRYQEFEVELLDRVNAGRLSEVDMELKLLEMRKRLFERDRQVTAEREGLQNQVQLDRYEANANRIKEAVNAGRLSEVEAELKLLELRQAMVELEVEMAQAESQRRDNEAQKLEMDRERLRKLSETSKAHFAVSEEGKVTFGDRDLGGPKGVTRALKRLIGADAKNAYVVIQVEAGTESSVVDMVMEAAKLGGAKSIHIARTEERTKEDHALEMAKKTKAVFEVTDSGKVRFHDQDLGGAAGVERLLKRMIEANEANAYVVIHADSNADYEVVTQVIDAAQKAGAKSVHLGSDR